MERRYLHTIYISTSFADDCRASFYLMELVCHVPCSLKTRGDRIGAIVHKRIRNAVVVASLGNVTHESSWHVAKPESF